MIPQMTGATTWIAVILLLANAREALAGPASGNSAHHLRRRTQRSLPVKRDTPQLQLRHNTQHHAKKALSPEWLIAERQKLDARYGDISSLEKRGEVTLANQDYDASYSASVSIGTPAQSFDIALDTGSADLWVTSTTCASSTCNSLPTKFDASKSSTFKNSSTPFTITYGSGNAQGYLGTDTVSLADYTVSSQTFAIIQTMSASLITEPLSGLMGLGFSSLAVSKSTPWWVSLATSKWNDPVFAFYLKRYRNVASASSTESDGGSVSFGGLDSSLYSGDITYVSVADNKQAYWNIPIGGITSQGTTINLGSSVNAAIDTGTTLIGGPASTVAAIYAAIPGSKAMSGSYAGYYEYPCSTAISMTMTFDSFTVEITQADFNIGSYSVDGTMCIGGVYVQSLSSTSSVQWIVGDTMLKNVYSVYRYSPAAVGFAKLASDTSSTGSSASSSASSGSAAISSTMASSSLGSAVSSASSGTASNSASFGTATATSVTSTGSTSASGSMSSSTNSDGVTVVTTVRAASVPPAAQTSVVSGATTAAAAATSSSTSAGFKVSSISAREAMAVVAFMAMGMALL
jgi:cathepsin D